MTSFEAFSMFIAFASFVTSCVAAYIAYQSNQSNKEIAKRQNIIDLHAQWSSVNDIDLNKIVIPDVVRAVNALSLTASLWNHDVIVKSVIYQSYWEPYRTLYDKLYGCNQEIEGLNRTGRSMMTTDISKAYHSMRDADISKLLTTKY